MIKCEPCDYWWDDEEFISCPKCEIKELEAENEQLSQQICDECSPDDYGWNYNAVEGRVPCVCITESGAYQKLEVEKVELKTKLALAEGDFFRLLGVAKQAAHHNCDRGPMQALINAVEYYDDCRCWRPWSERKNAKALEDDDA